MGNLQKSDASRHKFLLEERERLETRLDAIKADYRAGLSADFSEQAVELENREVLDEIARTTSLELDRVKKELMDIESRQ